MFIGWQLTAWFMFTVACKHAAHNQVPVRHLTVSRWSIRLLKTKQNRVKSRKSCLHLQERFFVFHGWNTQTQLCCSTHEIWHHFRRNKQLKCQDLLLQKQISLIFVPLYHYLTVISHLTFPPSTRRWGKELCVEKRHVDLEIKHSFIFGLFFCVTSRKQQLIVVYRDVVRLFVSRRKETHWSS